jgi:hypothetical protein
VHVIDTGAEVRQFRHFEVWSNFDWCSAFEPRSNAFNNFSDQENLEPEPGVRFGQILNPEPERCVRSGSVQVRTDFLNRTLPPLMRSPPSGSCTAV